MKITTLLAIAVFTAGCATYPTSVSAGGTSFVAYAKVVHVEEIRRNVQTRHQDCYFENTGSTYHSDDHNIGNELLGAIIGGVIGNQIGNHDAGATVAGAVIGGVIANNVESGHGHSSNQKHCTTTYRHKRELAHYRVTYEFAGQTFVLIQRNKPPFNHQKIAVSIQLTR